MAEGGKRTGRSVRVSHYHISRVTVCSQVLMVLHGHCVVGIRFLSVMEHGDCQSPLDKEQTESAMRY